MKKMFVITGIILALIAGVAYYGVTNYQKNTAGFVQNTEPKYKYDIGEPDAEELLELVNKARTEAGVKPLIIDERLVKSAQMKSESMFNEQNMSHVDKNGMHGYEYAMQICEYPSENIAWTEGIPTTSRQIFDSWMNSKPHHDAILNPEYIYTGIYNNQGYITEHFCAQFK